MDTKIFKLIQSGTPKYRRLTVENRIIIWTLKKKVRSKTYIAGRVGCSVSTISRELDRNKGKKGYRHKKAQGMAQHRIAVKAAKRQKRNMKMTVVRWPVRTVVEICRDILGYLAYLSKWWLSFSRLAGVVRGTVWIHRNLIETLRLYGTAGPVKTPAERPQRI